MADVPLSSLLGTDMSKHLTGNPAAGPGQNPVQSFLDWRNSGQSWADRMHAATQAGDIQAQLDLLGGFTGAISDASPVSALARSIIAKIGGYEVLANKSPMMYNPPVKPLRPFTADYPAGAPTDATGNLTADIEGRPLTAQYVVGRNMVGGADESLRPQEYDALAQATLGRPADILAPSRMGGDFGRTYINRAGYPEQIELRADMRPDKAQMVYAHELGHVVDQSAGQIPTAGLNDDLKAIFNTLNNPNRARGGLEAAAWGKPVTPKTLGYSGEEIPREHLAEAVRAYMADPNYLKTVAPKTAAVIRSAVNAHPTLSKIIQFNAIPLAVGSAAGLGANPPLSSLPGTLSQ